MKEFFKIKVKTIVQMKNMLTRTILVYYLGDNNNANLLGII